MNKKGFMHTLEAVFASTLMIGLVFTVSPTENSISNPEAIGNALKVADMEGTLRDNLTPENISSDIKDYVPEQYNYTVRIVSSNTTYYALEDSDSTYINKTGDFHELRLKIENPSNLEVNYGGQTLVNDLDKEKSSQVIVPGKGWLNTSGTGRVEAGIDSYNTQGSFSNRQNTFKANYIIWQNGAKEIQVEAWSR